MSFVFGLQIDFRFVVSQVILRFVSKDLVNGLAVPSTANLVSSIEVR